SETLEPEMLSRYLNEYLTPMTERVMSDGGLLDKYIGDAIMAVYGAPLEMTDHASRACATALAMHRDLRPLNESWRARGLPEIAIGIGVNSGPMAVGNMGSEARFDYTVMGDAVNLGARLEALTKEYGVDILTGEATAQSATGFVFRELDLVRVAGRQGTARVFELVGRDGDGPLSATQLAVFAGALEAYRLRDWPAAEAGFSTFLDQVPADGPAHVMRDRVRTLRHSPPPADWDGVYAQVTK
ncbi:MAG TPA: adenylate/guanylate cyclase domain-containing protein, partial [Kofleriaceae bacterium]|nr:adenylate/guanylate cyclase domain-containing protein [Kofleriaceae bacterium]